jgi:hypothetical protein
MKSRIQGLLNIKCIRGLRGEARQQWLLEAIEILLRAELARIEREESK